MARLFARISIILILCVTAVLIIVVLALKDVIAEYYTSDEEVQELATAAMGIFALALVPDSIINSQMGIYRGLGKQKIAVIIQILSLFLISIPLGCLFAYYFEMKVAGFWLGYAIRSFVAAYVYYYVANYKFDWEQIAREAKDREDTFQRAAHKGGPPGPPGPRGPPGPPPRGFD